MSGRFIYFVPLICGLALGLTRAANAGLVGHWAFDENSGAIASDSSGRGSDGTIEGNAHWVAGKMGSALNFDDSDDIVIIAHGKVAIDDSADGIRERTGCDDLEDAFVRAIQFVDPA